MRTPCPPPARSARSNSSIEKLTNSLAAVKLHRHLKGHLSVHQLGSGVILAEGTSSGLLEDDDDLVVENGRSQKLVDPAGGKGDVDKEFTVKFFKV